MRGCRNADLMTALIMIFVFVLTFFITPSVQASDDIFMEVKAGYAGYGKSGENIPVDIIIENAGSLINGYLEIGTSVEGAKVLYRKKTELASGSKKRINMYVPASQEQSYFIRLIAGDKV
ncbi:MAG: hypothetical protein PHR65_11620, partial [Syntrophomonadaceae bacterium]|nr:hypothetical protein [Syntrophomonadaceae bacterium]